MKFLNVPITVEARKGVPRRIRWGRRTYTVRRLLDFWILQSRWWAREEKRVYFRIETDKGVMEVYRGEGGDGGSEEGVANTRPPVADSRSEERGASEQRKGRQRKMPAVQQREAPAVQQREAPTVQQRKAPAVQQKEAPAVHPGGHPPFVEGDTHTRELRQTESPYRPDAAAAAARRFSETGVSDPGSKPLSAQELQTSGEVRHGGPTSSSGSSRETGCRWVLSKVID